MPRPRSANPKSVLLAVRVTPRTRFGLDLIARRSGRTVSQVITHAVEQTIESANQGLVAIPTGEHAPVKVVDRVWSPHEYERVVRLGLWFPGLLNEEQQYLWRVVRETPMYWRHGKCPRRPTAGEIHWEQLADGWGALKERAQS